MICGLHLRLLGCCVFMFMLSSSREFLTFLLSSKQLNSGWLCRFLSWKTELDPQHPQERQSSWQLQGWSRLVCRVGVRADNWKGKASYCLRGCPQNCEVFFFFHVESMSRLALTTKFLCEKVSLSSFLCYGGMSELLLQFRNFSDVIWMTSKGMKREIFCHHRKLLTPCPLNDGASHSAQLVSYLLFSFPFNDVFIFISCLLFLIFVFAYMYVCVKVLDPWELE